MIGPCGEIPMTREGRSETLNIDPWFISARSVLGLIRPLWSRIKWMFPHTSDILIQVKVDSVYKYIVNLNAYLKRNGREVVAKLIYGIH